MTRKLYLIRHAQSLANIDREALFHTPNMDLGLSEEGIQQARAMAAFLVEELQGEQNVQLWVSPYRRTQQTAAALLAEWTSRPSLCSWQQHTSIHLAERQFGLVDTHPDFERTHGAEMQHYRMHQQTGFGFWARPPLGESPFDVCLRIDFFLKSILPPEGTHILVSHGMALRALQMMELGLSVSDYDTLPNPDNASVRRIRAGLDEGVLFTPASKA